MTLEQIKARLKEMEAEAQRLADQEKLSQTDIDRIVELKDEQEALVAELDARDKLAVIRSLSGRLDDEALEDEPEESRSSAVNPPKWDEQRTLDYFMAVRRGDSGRAATVMEHRDANTIVGPDGGFVVPEDVQTTINQRMFEASILASKCQQIRMSGTSNSTKWPYLVQDNMGESTAFGGVTAQWLGEGGTLTASQPEFETMKIDLQKLGALVVPTEEILQDAAQFDSFLRGLVPRALAYTLDGAIFEGNGAGKPLGYHTSANAALVTVAKESGQAADTILLKNIVKMFARMPGWLLSGAEWHLNQDVLPELLTLNTDSSNGVPVYMPGGNISGAPFGTILGRPVVLTPHNATLGDSGDITFANLGEYLLAQKGGVRADASIHVYFTSDKTAMRFVRRVDGKPGWKTATTPKKGSSTLSPFVTLAARA